MVNAWLLAQGVGMGCHQLSHLTAQSQTWLQPAVAPAVGVCSQTAPGIQRPNCCANLHSLLPTFPIPASPLQVQFDARSSQVLSSARKHGLIPVRLPGGRQRHHGERTANAAGAVRRSLW